MKYGLLWYDNDPRRPLEDKIGRAARRYHDKYGSWPNTCFVHPEAVAGLEEQELKVRSPARKQDTIQVVSACSFTTSGWGRINILSTARGRRPPIDPRSARCASLVSRLARCRESAYRLFWLEDPLDSGECHDQHIQGNQVFDLACFDGPVGL
jgi:hypothetical protein